MNLWKLSWSYLRSKPLNTALSMVLVALGVGLASFLLLMHQQFKDRLYKNIDGISLVIAAKGSPLQMILSSVYHIDVPTGNIPLSETTWLSKNRFIEKAIPMALGDSYRSFRIVGTDHRYIEHYKGQIAQGKLWEKDLEATIGSAVARRLNMRIGNTFYGSHGVVGDDAHTHEEHAYEVVGILQETGTVIDQLIFTNIASVWRMHEGHDHEEETTPTTDSTATDTTHQHDHAGHDHDHAHGDTLAPISTEGKEVTAYLVQYKRIKNEETGEMESSPMARVAVTQAIDEHFTTLGYADPAIQLQRLLDMTGLGLTALQMLSWLIIGISAFSMFISLYSSLKERRYELALLRVMGASRRQLFVLVVLEGMLVALLGFLLGELLSHTAMSLLAEGLSKTYQYEFSGWIFLSYELLLGWGALLIGFFSALIPAWQAYQTDISRTLSA